MTNEYSIRPVDKKDEDQLTNLLRTNYEGLEDSLIQQRVEEQLTTSFDAENPGMLFVAETNGQCVGLAYMIEDGRRSRVLIDDLYTSPEHEGRGIGSALLNACREHAASLGETHIHLSVEAQKPELVSFYEKRGWVKQPFEAATGGTSYIDPINDRVETHLMQLSV